MSREKRSAGSKLFVSDRYSKDSSRDRNRKESICSSSKACGACEYIDTPYEKQLEEKQLYLAKLLGKYGKIDPILPMENSMYYRHKVHAVIHRSQRGEIYSGTYMEGSHVVVPIKQCHIEHKAATAIIQTVVELVKSFKLTVYNENSGYGFIRHALVRVGYRSGEIMLILVTADPVFKYKNDFVKALLRKHPEITTIVQNVNDRTGSMVLGARNVVIHGKGYIVDSLCDCQFRISPSSFYQVNPQGAELLYQKAISLAGLTGGETVLDAYCGTGTIGIVASKQAGKVIGVELNKDAVKDAIANAKNNQRSNVTFYQNDAGKFMISFCESGEKLDVVLMDPPRSGSDEAFMDALLYAKPKKIVYISCGPESLARDLEYILSKRTYRVEKICPVDLFPMTKHVETVVLMSRVKGE